jgi:hypothetical protein
MHLRTWGGMIITWGNVDLTWNLLPSVSSCTRNSPPVLSLSNEWTYTFSTSRLLRLPSSSKAAKQYDVVLSRNCKKLQPEYHFSAEYCHKDVLHSCLAWAECKGNTRILDPFFDHTFVKLKKDTSDIARSGWLRRNEYTPWGRPPFWTAIWTGVDASPFRKRGNSRFAAEGGSWVIGTHDSPMIEPEIATKLTKKSQP